MNYYLEEGYDVFVVWTNYNPGKPDIFFPMSKNNGNTFNQTINLSNNTGSSQFPQISSSIS